MRVAIGHVKLILESSNSFLIGNLTGTNDTLCFRGQLTPSSEAHLTLNARVQTSPEQLEQIVNETLAASATDHINVSAPRKAWRILPGASPGMVRG